MAFSLDQFYQLNRRALIWIILLVVIWLMRDFFSLIFLTFILAFIATPLARLGERYLRLSRRLAIVVVYLLFLLALGSFANYVTPRAIREANTLLGSLPQTQEKMLSYKNVLVAKHPSLNPLIMGYIRSALPEDDFQAINDELIQLKVQLAGVPTTATTTPAAPAKPALQASAADIELTPAAQAVYKAREDELLIKAYMGMATDILRKKAPGIIKFLWGLSGTMLLALLFSFLITLDITRLSQELKSLRASRLHDFYEQAAQPVVRFAYVVGRAFQAQAAIACVNAGLTCLGLILMGLPSLAMLTLIVFVCSFIPVLGVFISTTPIVLVALNSGGLGMAAAAIVLVIVIHMIEAYFLNPVIYGKHLKLNPVLVLIILFIGHHAFGIWGMLLGVPVAYYFIHDVFGVPIWGARVVAPKSATLASLPRNPEAPKDQSPPAAESAARVGAEPRE